MFKQHRKGIFYRSPQKEEVKSLFCNFVFCLCVILLSACSRQSDDPSWIATELVYTFITADLDKAKSLTVPEQWDRIAEWMIERESFECEVEEWEDETINSVGGYRYAHNEWISSVVYECAKPQTPYCLQINDVKLRKTEDGWKIYDWGSVCEAFDYSIRCEQLCSK